MPEFTIVGDVTNQEVIARGSGIHILTELRASYGGRNRRKCKGEASIELLGGRTRRAGLHWYEAHGIGKRRMKYLD